MNDYSILFSYFLLIFLLGLIVSMGAPTILDSQPPMPNYQNNFIDYGYLCNSGCTDTSDWLCRIFDVLCSIQNGLMGILYNVGYALAMSAYFFQIIGLTSVQYPILGIFLSAFTFIVVYIIYKLYRGTG